MKTKLLLAFAFVALSCSSARFVHVLEYCISGKVSVVEHVTLSTDETLCVAFLNDCKVVERK